MSSKALCVVVVFLSIVLCFLQILKLLCKVFTR